jgi:hypothetical protein
MAKTAKPIVVFLVMVAILNLPMTTMASENVISITIPLDDVLYFGDCAPEGQGEEVSFEGRIRLVVREDVYTPGGTHQVYHTNWMGVQGTGMTTGDRYVLTEVFNLTANGSRGAYEYTYATGFRIVSQASGDNYILYNTIHLTEGPDGEVQAWIEFLRAECQG